MTCAALARTRNNDGDHARCSFDACLPPTRTSLNFPGVRLREWSRVLHIQRLDGHRVAGAEYLRPNQAEEFLALLPELVRSMRGCDVILYQAGADPHVNDPLGGWLDDAQLQRRDELVFATAKELGVPIVWNLAGGYQRDAHGGIAPVLAIHAATARAAIEVYG